MKKVLLILLLTSTQFCFAQTDVLLKYQQADSLMQKNNFKEAFRLFKEIEPQCDKNDTLYSYILWYFNQSATLIESEYRLQEKFDSSLYYGLEALKIMNLAKPFFNEEFASNAYFMIKNIVVSYFGLGQLENAQKYKDMLYAAYKNKELPKGIDEYFNFSYFKWQDKNIWGYEWFEELPENRFSKSFSKIV